MIRNLSIPLVNLFKRNFEESIPYFSIYACLHIIGSAFYYLFNYSVTEVKEHIFIRAIGMILLAMTFSFKANFPKNTITYLPLSWFLTLTYNGPFLFSYFLLSDPTNATPYLYFPTVLIIFILLIDWKSFSIILVFGIVAAFFAVRISEPDLFHIVISQKVLVPTMVAFVMNVILFTLFREKTIALAKEKQQASKIIGAIVAHELKTPISGIALRCDMLSHVIRKTSIDVIEQKLISLSDYAKQTYYTIEALLTKLCGTERLPQEQDEVFSIAECIQKVVDEFPYSIRDSNFEIKININEDFKIFFNKNLMYHCFLNFLKNALQSLRKKESGKIEITVTYKKVTFRDSGVGISKTDLKNVFNFLYGNNTGIGLYFCKQVMDLLHGKINSTSEIGSFAEFNLIFPENI